MSKYIFACKSLSSTGQQSELVKLGILSKEVSQYTVADIGSIISIPYNDESGKILLNNGCIEFEVVGVNHHKDIYDESKPTITLMTKNIIRYAAFDAKEPNNPFIDSYDETINRTIYGNNRWGVSNIRQWLNSEDASNEWFTPQHEYDEAPTIDKVYNKNKDGAYADDPGFLVGFSDAIKQHFATVRNKTILCYDDELALSKDFEETEDKVFLPSSTEMGFENLNFDNKPEGTHLSHKFINDNSRIKTGANCWYWTRSCQRYNSYITYYIGEGGGELIWPAAGDNQGIAPILVLC
jgi:hypothetical protein